MKFFISILCCFAFLVACTKQEKAKNYGGTMAIELPKGTKFVVATWKDDNLWYATRPMRKEETADTITLQESSSFGVWEGKVVFYERK